jgi:RNA polymerase sigma-70 factor (ECF subfamily)
MMVTSLTMTHETDEFLPTRLSLLGRLRNWEDGRSWQEFFDTYHRLIHSVALRAGLTRAEAQDVVQETVLAVAKKVGDFQSQGQGSFKAWLLMITRWRIADQFERRAKLDRLAGALPPVGNVRSRAGFAEDDARTSTLHRVPDPTGFDLERVWDEEWEKNLLAAATARVKAAVTPKQFQVFELSVLRGWPVGKVVRALGVSTATVYLARHRVGRLLRSELNRLRAEGLPGVRP